MENKKELLMTIGLTKEDKSDFGDKEIDSFFDEFIDLVEKYNFCAGGGIKPYDEKTDLFDTLKIGDTIKWSFPKDHTSKTLAGKEFTAEIQMIDIKDKFYGVYAEYGQDFIPFKDAVKV